MSFKREHSDGEGDEKNMLNSHLNYSTGLSTFPRETSHFPTVSERSPKDRQIFIQGLGGLGGLSSLHSGH